MPEAGADAGASEVGVIHGVLAGGGMLQAGEVHPAAGHASLLISLN